MCPAAVKLWMNVRYRILATVTTAVAGETFTAPANAERLAFLMTSNGGNINYRPQAIAAGQSLFTYTLAGTGPNRWIKVTDYGTMILEPWVFQFVNAGNTYTITELYTPASLLNEIVSR